MKVGPKFLSERMSKQEYRGVLVSGGDGRKGERDEKENVLCGIVDCIFYCLTVELVQMTLN